VLQVATVVTGHERLDWVVLVYRVPREPSSPRIAIWRKLRALGVGQLGDGVVALPEDARTREHLEWVADRVLDAGGAALLLRAQPLTLKDEQAMAGAMAAARAEEYRDLTARARVVGESVDGAGGRVRAVKRLRRDLRTIQRRDFFPPPERDDAVKAVNAVAAAVTDPRPAARTAVGQV
jgi:hypothetical protein